MSRKYTRLPSSYLVQVHPTSLVDPEDPTNLSKFLAPESMRGSGGILLDAQGKRFANELTTRSVLTDAIFKAGTPMPGGKKEDGSDEGIAPTVAYLVLNEEAADAFGTGVLGFYISERAVRYTLVSVCMDGGGCCFGTHRLLAWCSVYKCVYNILNVFFCLFWSSTDPAEIAVFLHAVGCVRCPFSFPGPARSDHQIRSDPIDVI